MSISVLRLAVDSTSIRIGASNVVTGDIAIVVGSEVFPAEGWNDFVLVVVESWLAAVVRLLQLSLDVEYVHFMEGPFVVEMVRESPEIIRFRGIERPSRERFVADVEVRGVVENAIAVGMTVRDACRKQGIRSSDSQRLESSLAAVATLDFRQWRSR